MLSKDKYIAVLVSDLHISPNPPIARSVESNWYDVQDKYLSELIDLCDLYNCPLVIAGDIFHKPIVPPETINFLMKRLPENTFAIPGQHDLPDHRYDDIQKSSFYTLVLSGSVKLLENGIGHPLKGDWLAYGYPWGFDIEDDIMKEPGEKALAVVHSYIWMGDNKYEGAPKGKNINKWLEKLRDREFDAAVFGDNHKGFYCMSEVESDPWIMNCGTFIRRNIDEINYKPMVGLLHESGAIHEYLLECEDDNFIDVGDALKAIESAMEATDFIRELSGLGKTLIDFMEAVERFCVKNGVDKRVMQVIQNAMESKK